MTELDALLNELDATEAPKPKRTRAPLPDKFYRIEDFNPDSQKDILALCAHLGVKLPRRKDSDDEEALSTEKKFLLRAAKKHPILRTVIDCRERWKMIATYNWRLDSDNRVHSIIGHHPSTWRKSSRDYNLQNIPKRSELAHEFRRMVVAPAGHIIVEADSSAIEAVLVGYFARSESYVRLARSGIHDWFNSVVHGDPISLELQGEALRVACRDAKSRYDKRSRDVAKRVVHLTAYHGTPERMHEEYPEDFETVREARRLQNMLLATGPGQDLQRWWDETLKQSAHDRYLTTPFGARHRFFATYAYDKRRQCFILGDDAKRAIAFRPQNSASMIQDNIISALWTSPIEPWLRLPIHDSLLAVVPQKHAQTAAKVMYDAFTAPIPELGGLTIGAEINLSEVAGNWSEMKEFQP